MCKDIVRVYIHVDYVVGYIYIYIYIYIYVCMYVCMYGTPQYLISIKGEEYWSYVRDIDRVSHTGGTVLEGTEIIQQGDDHSMMRLYIWMIGFSRFFRPLSLVGARKTEWSDLICSQITMGYWDNFNQCAKHSHQTRKQTFVHLQTFMALRNIIKSSILTFHRLIIYTSLLNSPLSMYMAIHHHQREHATNLAS
jgi:hypothetical protein